MESVSNQRTAVREIDIAMEDMDLDELEALLNKDLDDDLKNIEKLKEDFDKIGNPDTLGETVMRVVAEQFNNQIAAVAGEEFIEKNGGLTLDLRDEAHIQTTENFANGKIATHNKKINYQQRYDDWQSNFERDDNGNIKTHYTRTGKEEANLVKGARKPFDKDRPTGSKDNNIDMDHTISAGEQIRDPEANAHMTREEQIAFANSNENLNELEAQLNRSKGDLSMEDWLNTPNAKGQTPEEIFNITPEQKKALLRKDKEARAAYEKVKKEAEKRSIEAGKESQKEEAFRIGGEALKAAIFQLLTELLKKVIQKLILWFKQGKKKISNLCEYIKDAIKDFFANIKEKLLTAGKTVINTILTAIYGPIVGFFNKLWILLKQGWRSLKEAYKYLISEEAKNHPFSVKVMQVSKIIVAGLSAGGAIVVGELIEKALMTIPVFTVPIPLIGNLASVVGLFMGALLSGLAGACAINLIDKFIAGKLKDDNTKCCIDTKNNIIVKQMQLNNIAEYNKDRKKEKVACSIIDNHSHAVVIMKESLQNVEKHKEEFDNNLDEVNNMIKNW